MAKWKNIKSAPTNEIPVLLVDTKAKTMFMGACYDGVWRSDFLGEAETPTLWMHLPEWPEFE